MFLRKVVYGFLFALALICVCQYVHAQEKGDPMAGVPEGLPADQSSEPEIAWLWGEVVKVNAPAGEMVIRHLDYENDVEKETLISTDVSTTYENTKALVNLKPKDSVSIDYVVVNGKNVAKSIALDNPDSLSDVPEANMSATAPSSGVETGTVAQGENLTVPPASVTKDAGY